MNGISRLRLPETLFLFSSTAVSKKKKKNSPKLYVWDITSNFICSSLFVPNSTL